MRITIFYFSGTGNTRMVAERYAAEFQAMGFTAALRSLPDDGEADADELAASDIIGFGYPVHAFNAPKIMLKLAKSLPKLEEAKRAFIFKTSGEPVRMSDVSSLKLIKLLKKRNIRVENEYQYVMPYNIIFRHTDDAAYRMWETAKALIPVDCHDISIGKPHAVKRMFMGGFLAWILRVEHFGARFNGKFYKATSDCVNCGLCVNECPAKNITVKKNGKLRFGGKCMMCMRCSLNCPKNAVKIGLFNGWKVNGKYSFDPPSEKCEKSDKHENYCKKAYDRYYAEAEKRIENYEKEKSIGE